MKIIEQGKKPTDLIYTGTCEECFCRFECNGTELVPFEKWVSIVGGRAAICPNCQGSVVMVRKS